MPNLRRAFIRGGTFFFTLVTNRRAHLFAQARAKRLLGTTFRRCQEKWPFTFNALVLLPDHLHAIWSLPPGDDEYPKRWGWIKKEFTKEWLSVGGMEESISAARQEERRRGVWQPRYWQPRYWEHTLEDEDDFERHFDYVHYNPVKHGYAKCPRDWPESSFHRWVAAGVYPEHWACTQRGFSMDFGDIEESVGEPLDEPE